MDLDMLRAVWRRGGATLNGWLSIPSNLSAEVMAVRGFDTATIDMQHGMIGFEGAVSMIGAVQLSRTVPLVRVPWADLSSAMRVLDAGAGGVILPLVNSAEDAAQFVAACRYPPVGIRSVGPTRARLYSSDYIDQANERVLLLAQVETDESVRNIEAIASVPGLDGVYVGPADLNASRGGSPTLDSRDEEFLGILHRVADVCRSRGLIAAIHCETVAYGVEMIAKGYQMITVQSDVRVLGAGAAAIVQEFRQSIEQDQYQHQQDEGKS